MHSLHAWNIPYAQKSIYTHVLELWNLTFVYLEIVLVLVQDRCMVCA